MKKHIKLLIWSLPLLTLVVMSLDVQQESGNFVEDQGVVVYEKFSDYENNTGEEYDDWVHLSLFKVTVRKGKKKTKFNGKEIWGFKYRGTIFRPIEYRRCFAALVNQGEKLFLYVQGVAQKNLLTSGKAGFAHDDCDPLFFVSKEIDSKIYFYDCHVKNQTSYKRFMKSDKTRKRLFTCIEEILSTRKVPEPSYLFSKQRECIEEYFQNEAQWIKEDSEPAE